MGSITDCVIDSDENPERHTISLPLIHTVATIHLGLLCILHTMLHPNDFMVDGHSLPVDAMNRKKNGVKVDMLFATQQIELGAGKRVDHQINHRIRIQVPENNERDVGRYGGG